jgi:hypothetical protein
MGGGWSYHIINGHWNSLRWCINKISHGWLRACRFEILCGSAYESKLCNTKNWMGGQVVNKLEPITQSDI